tara:strand:+ start:186 stop:512 length:327 start_codon:yes stop_codon:yes gene_type:complete
MSLANRLRELRVSKRESLQDVAEAVGVSKTHIWELEKGKSSNPSVELLRKFSDHFGISISQLIGESLEDPNASPELVRMFRQAGDLDDRERAILDATLKSLLNSRKST